jgi:endonuclease YncB( thermonuclease family)
VSHHNPTDPALIALTLSNLVLACTFAVTPCFAETFHGTVVGVTDGDTIKVTHNGAPEKIRLNGIDAPEKSQPFGAQAKEFVSSLCLGKTVDVTTPSPPKDKDRYGRTIGDIRLADGTLLNNEIVAAGLAWWYVRYAPDNDTLKQLEETARNKRLGLWIDAHPQPPWEYRHAQKTHTSPANVSAAPLQGTAETNASPLDAPPRPLQGQAQDTALQGHVEGDQNPLLHGKVAGEQTGKPVQLKAMTPRRSAVMRIVQFRQPLNDSLQSQAAVSQPQPEHAPLRATADDTVQRPMRAEATAEQQPKRDLLSQYPTRQTEQQPQRYQDQVAPVRTIAASVPPPSRPLLAEQTNATITQPQPENNNVDTDIQAGLKHTPFFRPREKKDKHRPEKPDKTIDKTTDARATTNSALPQLSKQEEELLWDKWYAHVNDMVCQALSKTMPLNGNPAGSDRVHITVWPDHRLTVSLIETSNSSFDTAVTSAYRSLNGDRGLEFPRGTRRTIVQYDTAHIQDVPAPTAQFDSTTIHGDLERLK